MAFVIVLAVIFVVLLAIAASGIRIVRPYQRGIVAVSYTHLTLPTIYSV